MSEEKIEELEQALFELCTDWCSRHLLPGVRVLSLCANPAQDWTDLCQAALHRFKEENTVLLERLSALKASDAHSAPSASNLAVTRLQVMPPPTQPDGAHFHCILQEK
jgi:hypothetical protein